MSLRCDNVVKIRAAAAQFSPLRDFNDTTNIVKALDSFTLKRFTTAWKRLRSSVEWVINMYDALFSQAMKSFWNYQCTHIFVKTNLRVIAVVIVTFSTIVVILICWYSQVAEFKSEEITGFYFLNGNLVNEKIFLPLWLKSNEIQWG